jgi:hypothetical protein
MVDRLFSLVVLRRCASVGFASRAVVTADGQHPSPRTMRPRTSIAIFLPLAILATCLCGLISVGLQQDLRTGANDPQQQLAEDAAARLNAGAAPGSVAGGAEIDIAASLAPFVVVYDAGGAVLASNGQLDNLAPMLPRGVLANARSSGLDAVTWQPRAGVRIATVSVPWNGGVVTAGRSLRLVEDRESQLEVLVGVGWVATLVALTIASVLAAAIAGTGQPADPDRAGREDRSSSAP